MSTAVDNPPGKRWWQPDRRVPTAAELPALRINMARTRHGRPQDTEKYWVEITPERLKRRQIGSQQLYIDLASGKVYRPIKSSLWEQQVKLWEANEATVAAWLIVDDDVLFLERATPFSTLAE